jgi:hypothetical protein
VDDQDWSTSAKLTAWRILTQQQETAALPGSGETLVDVPFSLADRTARRVIRGTIDVLIRRADGSIEVIALASGTPSLRHEQRLALCVEAAQRMFPGAAVNGRTQYCNP